MRSLISHLRIVKCLIGGSSRNVDPETKQLWVAISTKVKGTSLRGYGVVTPLKKSSISRKDVVYLTMEKNEHGCTDEPTMQAWLACYTLTAAGTRPGSIQMGQIYHRTPSRHGIDAYEAASPLRRSPSRTPSPESTPRTPRFGDVSVDIEDCEDEKETKQVSNLFQGLRTSDVDVYRLRRSDDDHADAIRLRVVVRVRRSKTSGFSHYNCQPIGVTYPQKMMSAADHLVL
uniref:Uncharacterized protein n=1 Tax=Heterorhabditis bacteriophora TaxID=37862 RepID=A0A1I7WKQ1_HETBA